VEFAHAGKINGLYAKKVEAEHLLQEAPISVASMQQNHLNDIHQTPLLRFCITFPPMKRY
jgi:hypothetical protein